MVRPESFRIAILVLRGLIISSCLQQRADAKYIPVKPIWNETWTDHLKTDLLLNYDKFARPAEHFNATKVTIDITVRHVTIDELKSVMTVHGWVKMYWADEKLKWNASNYGGLKDLHLGDHEVWKPDIVLYNSAAGNSIDYYGNTQCIVSENGTVIWVPPSQFMAFCDLDLRYWPFDTQVCQVKLGSWTFSSEQVDLRFPEDEGRPELLVQSSEWTLKRITRRRNVVRYPCCPEDYVDVEFNLTMERQSPSYMAVVVTPITAIVFLTLVTFWLPPQCGDKITVGACTTILISLFLLYFNQKLPSTARNTPLIIHFYSCSLYLVSISLAISVTVINMSKKAYAKPLPWKVNDLLIGWLGRILGLNDTVQLVKIQRASAGEEMRESQTAEANQSISSPLNNCGFDDGDRQNILTLSKSSQLEWTLAAMAIDRIAFLFYCLVFIILAVRCSI